MNLEWCCGIEHDASPLQFQLFIEEKFKEDFLAAAKNNLLKTMHFYLFMCYIYYDLLKIKLGACYNDISLPLKTLAVAKIRCGDSPFASPLSKAE